MIVDDAVLRSERRERVIAEMDHAGVDVLLLGREGNIRYVTGAHRLWLAGMRGWAPSCVVVRKTGAVHLLSITDAGVPPEIPADRLYPITWNPMNLFAAVAAIEGVGDAATMGVDGSTPLMRDLIRGVLPSARLVDAQPLLHGARRVKGPAEVDALRQACAVAREALKTGAERADVGAEPPEIEGAVRRRAAELGATAVGAPFEVTPWSISVSVLAHGYEGVAARAAGEPAERCAALGDALVERCRAGEPLVGLRAVYDYLGESLPPGIIARGTGVGPEHPVLRAAGDGGEVLEPGMTLVVNAAVAHEDSWPAATKVVVVTDGEPEVLDS